MVVDLIEQDEADRNRIGKAFFSREGAKTQSHRRPCAGRGHFGSQVPRFQTGPCLRRGDGIFDYTQTPRPLHRAGIADIFTRGAATHGSGV